MKTLVYVHGGVAGVAKEALPDLGGAIHAGTEAETALDAVEAAVRALEDDPALNAGWGSVLNAAGGLELDAGISDGATGRAGGVASVTVRHPITLARRVLEHTPHVLIAGAGAEALGRDMQVYAGSTPEQHQRWLRAAADGALDPARFGAPENVDTVGAVALDPSESLAAGSSTGGVFGKLPGRMGDAAVFGAGHYASGAVAVVGTGVGERFLESLACLRVGLAVERGATPQEACEEVVALLAATGAVAGLLALGASGGVGAAFNGGAWAVAGPGGPVAAVRWGR